MLLPLTLVSILAPAFSGLFLWSSPASGVAMYCQLTEIRQRVTGDCYVARVNGLDQSGVTTTHAAVKGKVDGATATLRGDEIFNMGSNWGTASLNSAGFVLTVAMPSGPQEVQFRRVESGEVNAVLARVRAAGKRARGAYVASSQLRDVEREMENARYLREYAESRVADAESAVERAERDTLAASQSYAASLDSIEHVRLPDRGVQRGRADAAAGRLDAARSRLEGWITRLNEARAQVSQAAATVARDSVRLAGQDGR